MSIEFACPTCSGTLRVGDESAGRVIRCGACMTTLRVPGTAAEPTAAPDAPAAPEAPRSPFESAADPDAPAAAIPVARPRAKVRDYDDRDRERDADQPRRRRRGPPPRSPGRSALFWLGLVGGLFLLVIGGCCGGLYLAVPDAKWQKHESAKGGFKVDLPAPARKDMDKMAGGVPDPNAPMEGTILFRRLQEYVVVYRDLPPHERQATTDKALMDAAVDGMKSSGEVDAVLSQKDIVVNGFPGREVEFSGKEGGHYTARVVIADGRLYMLVAGGKLADRNEPNVRRFLDSFEITDPKLRAAGDAKQAATKQAEEFEQKRKEQQERDRVAREQAEKVLEAAREKVRLANDAYLKSGGYDGPKVPEHRAAGDRHAFPCESADEWAAAGVVYGPGVRGRAGYLPASGDAAVTVAWRPKDAELLKATVRAWDGYTLSGWVRVRDTPVTLFQLTGGQFGPTLDVTVTKERVLARANGPKRFDLKHEWTGDEKWHHVAFVSDRNGSGTKARLYVDGELVASSELVAYIPGTEESLKMGWVVPPLNRAPSDPAAGELVGAVDECLAIGRPLGDADVLTLTGLRARAPAQPPLPQAPAPRLAPERPLAPPPRLVPERD